MKSIEKYLWAIALIMLASNYFMHFAINDIWTSSESVGTKYADRLADNRFRLYLNLIFMYAQNVVSGVWLWHQAKVDSLSKPAWSVFGIASGLIGVIVFYAASVFFELKSLRQRKGNSNKT